MAKKRPCTWKAFPPHARRKMASVAQTLQLAAIVCVLTIPCIGANRHCLRFSSAMPSQNDYCMAHTIWDRYHGQIEWDLLLWHRIWLILTLRDPARESHDLRLASSTSPVCLWVIMDGTEAWVLTQHGAKEPLLPGVAVVCQGLFKGQGQIKQGWAALQVEYL